LWREVLQQHGGPHIKQGGCAISLQGFITPKKDGGFFGEQFLERSNLSQSGDTH